ncbi:MAG: tRNA pseudouridine(38-40) synthase TruA [Bryobacteraceae bacterium]|nr:tRNA pseudouridine(38-40) synthase TruA [Bryobacteraceae bacterium]
MRRIRFTLAYDGTDFHGWQVQPGQVTIQGTLQEILSELEGGPVILHGSGRTDAGVHAMGQVAACTMANPLPLANLQKALNRFLPEAIRVLSVSEAEANFQPRFDAVAKTYEYRIARGEICSPFERRFVHHFPYPLDEAAFLAAAPYFAGEHDFSTFAAADARDELDYSKVRTIFSSEAFREPGRLIYRVRGSGFLKHMVRNLVGTLLEVGKGNHVPADIPRLLSARDRSLGGATAPGSGLFLVSVEYPTSVRLTGG